MFRRSSFNIFDVMSDRVFAARYLCYPVSKFCEADRSDLDKGGKILLPPNALEELTKYHISSPMLFKLHNEETDRSTHAGVLEFVAETGKCYLPNWMMKNLQLNEGDMLHIQNVVLQTAKFSRFQPLTEDFLDITNPTAVLENSLRYFACLTKNDIIAIHYNKKIYELLVLETKPYDAVSIIECDMDVEFTAPLETEKQKEKENLPPEIQEEESDSFIGSGQRLDGKKKKSPEEEQKKAKKRKKGIPIYDYEKDFLSFNRQITPISDLSKQSNEPSLQNKQHPSQQNFPGEGASL